MEKVEAIEMEYFPEKRVDLIEKHVRTYPYLNPVGGYKVEKKEGDWLILKKEQTVFVWVKKEDGSEVPAYGAEDEILKFYQAKIVTYELFNKFCEHIRNKVIEVRLDDNNRLVIVKS